MFKLKTAIFNALVLAAIPVSAHAAYNEARDVDAPRQTVVTGGWEKGLVQGDPSLKHWNWSAMYSVVSRPRKLAMPVNPHVAAAATPAQPSSSYTKPSTAAIPAKLLADMSAARGLSGSQPIKHSTSTSLKFSTKHTIATLAYAKGYPSSPEGTYEGGGQSTSTAVQGKLLR